MNAGQLSKILSEIKEEQHISPLFSDDSLKQYIVEAEFNINDSSGKKIDYDIDLDARSLLKTYVMYANHKKLAEFKALYAGDYAGLQAKYYKNTSIS